MADAAPAPDAEFAIPGYTDTGLYSLGAYFADRHPDLLDEVIAQSEEIERRGLDAYAERERVSVEQAFRTLVTGLAVRYFKAVAGTG